MLVISKCFCVFLCVGVCTGHFVMVPLNLTYLHCLQHYFLNISSIYINHIPQSVGVWFVRNNGSTRLCRFKKYNTPIPFHSAINAVMFVQDKAELTSNLLKSLLSRDTLSCHSMCWTTHNTLLKYVDVASVFNVNAEKEPVTLSQKPIALCSLWI